MASGKGFDMSAFVEKLQNIDIDDINNADWENMGSWPLLGRASLALVLFVGLCVAGYYLLIVDQVDQLASEQQQEVKLKKEFEVKAFKISNLDQYRAQLLEMEESFGSLLKQLPRDTEVPGLIDDISGAALGAGLKLDAIDPSEMTKAEFYNELPIDIAVTGGFHEMGSFVSTVASLPRIVTLHDFSIQKLENSDLTMKIQAKTYQYNPEEE